jgi:hypothetical protein
VSALIGSHAVERPTCANKGAHWPNCYNPNSDDTYCQCGDVRWSGRVGTWHARQLRDPDVVPEHGRPRPGAVTGWDVYYLHANGCPDERVNPERTHLCEVTA